MENRLNRRAALVLGGLALCALVIAVPSHGGVAPSNRVELTFNRPISLPGVTLAAGTYVFERPAPLSAIEIVRVSSQDRRFIYFMGYTELVKRPAGRVPQITFGEAPEGNATPIREWYPEGSSSGHQFLYR
jgi:hypothetical protein